MGTKHNDRYGEGYIAGYLDGIRDARSGKEVDFASGEVAALPVRAMGVSPRARNCLTRAGCSCVSDVLSLDAQTVAAMRNMGTKTAAEIAHWLASRGICNSVWVRYL